MKLNKLLGQHFLINQKIIDMICNACDIKDKKIVEIGGGSGKLTNSLSDFTNDITVIEIDPRCAPLLSKYNLIIGDCMILDYDKYDVIIGNLPYNISQNFIIKLLRANYYKPMLFMVQLEVGLKFINHSYLAVLTAINYTCSIVTVVKPHNFTPKPKVDSIVIKFEPINNINLNPLWSVCQNLFTNPKRKLKSKWPAFSDVRIGSIDVNMICSKILERN